MAGSLVFGFSLLAGAGGIQRIGHTTLTPQHNTITNADGTMMTDDKGMYAAVIDPANGYAYFFFRTAGRIRW
jgi:hypothetical protein